MRSHYHLHIKNTLDLRAATHYRQEDGQEEPLFVLIGCIWELVFTLERQERSTWMIKLLMCLATGSKILPEVIGWKAPEFVEDFGLL